MRFSGAARILLPYRIHRAATTAEAVSIVNDAVGSTGNPVVNVVVNAEAGTLTVVFADGTSRAEDLPAGTGGGGGLRQIGSETLTIATTYEWIATALPGSSDRYRGRLSHCAGWQRDRDTTISGRATDRQRRPPAATRLPTWIGCLPWKRRRMARFFPPRKRPARTTIFLYEVP